MIMAVKTRTVAICDICGFMVDATELDNGMDYSTPENWSHGKSGNIDICPRCAKKLENLNGAIVVPEM